MLVIAVVSENQPTNNIIPTQLCLDWQFFSFFVCIRRMQFKI